MEQKINDQPKIDEVFDLQANKVIIYLKANRDFLVVKEGITNFIDEIRK